MMILLGVVGGLYEVGILAAQAFLKAAPGEEASGKEA